jgi:molybdate transport system substrate-binding protein
MRKRFHFSARKGLMLILFLACCVAGSQLRADELTVFAAASLTDSLREIASAYEQEHGTKISFNLAASSFLARQIEEGAPADIFLSADEAKMDALEQRGRIINDTRQTLLGNSLVIVTARDSALSIHSPDDLLRPEVKQLALADPKAVPAGIYSRLYFEKIGIWNQIAPKVIPTANVRAALAAVESGNVEAGMVYSTDAGISKQVKVAYEVPPADSPKIRYPVAVIKDSEHLESAKQFLTYLRSGKASAIFRHYGFVVLPPAKPHEP